ncbi:DUF6216 family protein [Xanthomonas citri pv. malvacearum]|uniref:DUF6216 family protein n=1 Tax=Xanthomonas TaxID=338 RepID=UPI0015D5A2DA|nr:DUF6216 family protein [Xanthomonas citri]WAW86077.1 DUF6216 family protein [Xanthomonas citri pv. malvacearum]WAW90258.1 DUF6216 family protein [Xanthomonas citri pv. malvacearum]WAW94427.1 DUF6216 family protein [Xanthomonas citri pv. malvacearum]
MEWLKFLTGEIAAGSLIVFLLAAALTCWRTGSLHPINTRVLRLFISKDDIEDTVIRQNLADHSALAAFRMAHQIRVQTLKDAKALIGFSDLHNIPLKLIGHAGWAFDLKNHVIYPKRVHSKGWLVLPFIAVVAFIFFAAILGVIAANDSLLVTLKETHTRIFISETEARTQGLFSVGSDTLTLEQCKSPVQKQAIPQTFDPRDLKILCQVWTDPALKTHLSKEVPKQRVVSLAGFLFALWCAWQFYTVFRELLSANMLKAILDERQLGTSE